MVISRRTFLKNVAAVASVSSFHSQDPSRNEWGGSIVDCHRHLRRSLEANLLHLDGAGISSAVVLARENSADQIGMLRTQYPGWFLGWFASTDITKLEAEDLLTKAVKAGAIGLGELNSHAPTIFKGSVLLDSHDYSLIAGKGRSPVRCFPICFEE